MNPYAKPVILFTRDRGVEARLRPLMEQYLDLRSASSYTEFRRLTDQIGPGVALVDLRLPPDAPEPARLNGELPEHLLIALGRPHSPPMCSPAVEAMFGAEGLDTPPGDLVKLIQRAETLLDLREENRRLRREAAGAKYRETPSAPAARPDPERLFSTRELIRIVRCMDNVEALRERLLEELAVGMQLSRAGIALREDNGSAYRIRAGWMLLPGVAELEFPFQDPFVRWMERHAHVVSRASINLVTSGTDQLMLQRMLDRLGAELMLPLRGRGGVLGWFFTGHPLSGRPFDPEMTDQLILATDLIAVSLESAMLYREVRLRKTLGETLLNSLPVGVIYAGGDAEIRWFSSAAARILGTPLDQGVGDPLSSLGLELSELGQTILRRGEGDEATRSWRDPETERPLRATALRIGDPSQDLGVLITVEDRTLENALKEKEEHLGRSVFWNQLAASMSHEVRNPLVAIKTFAQLLPERYEDEEFRSEFSHLVGREIERLNGMIDQLNSFAHPPDFSLRPLDLRQTVQDAMARLRAHPPPGRELPDIRVECEPELPEAVGDAATLSECLEHLLRNAVEAMESPGGVIRIYLSKSFDVNRRQIVRVVIRDDGPGIPPEVAKDMYSPFCTTKPRGLGLGLSIAQRTLIDHNGEIDIQSTRNGTRVTLNLPAAKPGRRQ